MDVSIHDREKERFVAVRRKIFGDMIRTGAPSRLASMLPFHLGVLALLAFRGQAAWRSFVMTGAIAFFCVGLAIPLMRRKANARVIALVFGSTGYFASLVATGGLASPLLVVGVLPIVGAAMGLIEYTRVRRAFLLTFIGGVVALALLSQTPLGELAAPLRPHGAWPSPEYVLILAMSTLLVAVNSFGMGCAMSRAYEQVAFELVERREELCNESADRTRALEGIAARLAHEVKNPLAAIKGLSTHMARNVSDSKIAERLSIVAAEADRLQSIVDGFLSFSRGLEDLTVSEAKPYQLARELSLLLEARATDTGVSLVVTGDETVNVQADGRKLRQALLNLVLNAMQASPSGSKVRMHVERCPEGGAILRVMDEGSGMSPEVLERIRRPYFTTKEGGSGLGVAVARALIEQHGGKMSVESAQGRGTTVTIALPASAKVVACLPTLRKFISDKCPSKVDAPAEQLSPATRPVTS